MKDIYYLQNFYLLFILTFLNFGLRIRYVLYVCDLMIGKSHKTHHGASLLIAVAAVDFDEASVDEGVVDAETEGVHNLVDAGEAVDGGLAVDVLLDLLRLLFLPGGLHEAGDDGVDGGAGAFELLDEVLHEGMNCRLRHAIAEDGGMGVEPHLRAGEEDARAGRNKLVELTDDDIVGIDRHLHHPVPVGVGGLGERLADGHACIADDAVDGLALALYSFEEAIYLLAGGLVHRHGEEVRDLLSKFRTYVGGEDAVALREKHAGHAEAYAGGASGDNGCFHLCCI